MTRVKQLDRNEVENPSLRHLVNLARVFEVPVEELFEERWLEWYPRASIR